jgi:hypothetical protein
VLEGAGRKGRGEAGRMGEGTAGELWGCRRRVPGPEHVLPVLNTSVLLRQAA